MVDVGDWRWRVAGGGVMLWGVVVGCGLWWWVSLGFGCVWQVEVAGDDPTVVLCCGV